MTASSESLKQQRELVRGWIEAGQLLESRRRAALAALTPEDSRRAAFDMLQLGGLLPSHDTPRSKSGLVEMQRLFVLFRARGRT
jgi:hypothetical protein